MNNSESYVSDLIAMQNGWPVASKPAAVSHFTWEDSSPPMSHLGTPTEDFCPPQNSPVQSFSQHTTCLPLHMPMNSTTTAVTQPAQPVAPANAITVSTSSQQSLAIKQFKGSTVSDTPTPSPSSSDDDYSATSPALSDKHAPSECSEDFTLCKSKQEILKLIPKDVRVPQSKQ